MDVVNFFAVFSIIFTSAFGQDDRPRGVARSKAQFYDPSKDFTCLDGSATIKFEKVNDDYCDCADGTDEPGTPACPNGSFHCTNEGHKPKYVPSSRVNDGLCDCCDGTDEHDGHVKCANYCRELGKQMREEQEKEFKRIQAGHEIYLEYVQRGTDARREKEVKLEELKAEKEELEAQKNELENIKLDAEKPEKEAKDKHHEAWEVEKLVRREERNKKKMEDAFADLDANKDAQVSIEEMQKHKEFDIDSNGEVSADEAREYLDDNNQLKLDMFEEKVWPTIKEIYKAYDPVAEAEEKKRKRQKRSRMYDEAIPRSRLRRMRDNKEREEMVQFDEDYMDEDEDYDAEEGTEDVDWDELNRMRETGEGEAADPEDDDPTKAMKREERMKFYRKQRKQKMKEADEKKRKEHAKRREKIKIKRKPLPKPAFEEAKDVDDVDNFDEPDFPDFPDLDEFGREPEPSSELPIDDDPSIDDADGEDEDDDDDYNDEDDEEDRFPPRGSPRGDNGDSEEYDHAEKEKKPVEDPEDGPMPDYDEETKALIDIADKARADFDEVNEKFKQVEHEISEINKLLELDLGDNNEYYPLRGECYEYTDREYTYKYCPFDKTSQRNKHGGMETTLGNWGKWDGDEKAKHSKMRFEKGQNCWHGPDRTCTVKINCASENKLSYATEPNRCEYEFEFHSPAACSKPPRPSQKEPLRDEL